MRHITFKPRESSFCAEWHERSQSARGSVQAKTFSRVGTTLTEVLMAMLIAGIGLVTVASLFPIAILRAVQGTQLTNATILRYNAEAMIDIYPELIHDPDGTDSNSNGTPYDEHFGRHFIVDPVGWWVVGTDYQSTMPTLKTWFGNDGASPTTTPSSPTPNPIAAAANRYPRWLRRYNGGPTSTDSARQLVTLPDSWVLQFEGTPTAASLTGTSPSVTLPSTFDASSLGSDSRVVLFDSQNGRSGQIRNITNIAGTQVQWSAAQPVNDFLGVERVRVETREHRYTWLLTVRKNSFGDANIDVVVTFRRPFSAEDERAYDVTFLANDSRAWIKFTSDNGGVTGLPEPFVKKGSFVLDTANARWYRVIEVEEITGSAIDYDLRLTLDRRALESAGEDRIQGTATDPNGTMDGNEDTNGNGHLEFGGAIFMRGVVEVFPLGTRMFPRELLEGP